MTFSPSTPSPAPSPLAVPALRGRRVVLGVSGSISAYKAADLASRLVQAGAQVDVIMTASATRFVTPLTFESLVGRPVVTDLFTPAQSPIEHVTLARQAEVIIVAPATADIIGRLAHGRADDALTATVLASRAPVIVAPAMEEGMLTHPATEANLRTLRERGVAVVEPETGHLASGARGKGRLANREVLLGTVRHVLGRQGDLRGARIVVTAGGTREPLDPVRYITNRSSGKMGWAIAHAARDRGASVCIITAAPPPEDAVGMDVIPVDSALAMNEAVGDALARGADALIMAAAVADYRPRDAHEQKRKKAGDSWNVELVLNPDILDSHRGDFLRVGFAAETNDLEANARKKLEAKDLDWIVANDVTRPDSGFYVDTNRVTLYSRAGEFIPLPLKSKLEVADALLDRLAPRLQARIQSRAPSPAAAERSEPV